MIILDSSVIIALFRKEEAHHNHAREILMSGEKFLIYDFVLAEVLTVLKIREGFRISKSCAYFLDNNEDINIKTLGSENFIQSLSYFTVNKNKLSFVDTVLLVMSKKENLPVATFDKTLIQEFKN